MGCSLNWNEKYFTMDKKRSLAVTQAFIRLFNDGLIYRKEQSVNWDCHLQTVVSDVEVDHTLLERPTRIHVPSYGRP